MMMRSLTLAWLIGFAWLMAGAAWGNMTAVDHDEVTPPGYVFVAALWPVLIGLYLVLIGFVALLRMLGLEDIDA